MAGTLPIALTQQFSDTSPAQPLAGALLYFFQVGTVATPQNSYQDFGLTLQNPNPLPCNNFGRIPMFYLADGQVHVRLTDSSGVVIFDYPTMQVIGPSSGGGGGGGGGSIDPTTIFATGDIKFRATNETLTGWVIANALTIGSASSGASQRANADTQALYIYLWNEYTNAVCPVAGGRGASGLADFQANKTIGPPDWRGRILAGLDNMGNSAAGIIPGGTTPAAAGGEAAHTLLLAEAPTGLSTFNDPDHDHTADSPNIGYVQYVPNGSGSVGVPLGGSYGGVSTGYGFVGVPTTASASTGANLSDHGSNGAHNNLQPYVLGTIYMKL